MYHKHQLHSRAPPRRVKDRLLFQDVICCIKLKKNESTLLLLSGIWMFAKLPVLTSSVWQCVYVLSLGHIECLDLTAGGVMALPLTHMVTRTQQQRRKCWSSMTQDFDVTNPCPINPCVCVKAGTQGCRLCYSVLACFCCCQCIYCCFLLLLFSPSFLPLFFLSPALIF